MHTLTELLGGPRRARLVLALAASVSLAVSLVAVRVGYTHERTFAFLVWNTFLALCPLGASTLALRAERRGQRAALVAWLALWLLFLPNAPYMVTDLIHLRARHAVPLWYDLALLMSFAWNGLVLGLLSLHDVHGIIARRAGEARAWTLASLAIVLSGFGVYLGRYPRWNSWDVVTQPQRLLLDIADRFAHPLAHPRTWAVTVLFSTFLAVAYVTFRQLVHLGDGRAPSAPRA